MKQLASTFLLLIFLTAMSLTSCNQTSQTGDKEKQLTEKENELLKKENELLKKEQELNKQSPNKPTNSKSGAIQQNDNAASDNLDFMKTLNGKYPFDVNLLDKPTLKKRLKKMLGSRYDFMKSIWEVQTPIEISDGMFYAWAMQAHMGGDPGAVLMVDFNTNVVYVGIRENETEKLYSEDGSDVPKRLRDWADEQ